MFGKMKQFFGFVGIDVKLDLNTSIPKTASQVEGKVIIEAKAKQHITSIRVSIYEQYTIGSGDKEETETNDMGEWKMQQPFDINEGETKEFPFTLQFGHTEAMKDQGGFVISFGTAARPANNKRDYEYYVTATADVKGAALDPNQSERVFFVG